ncbi:MAG: phosphate propanoyltransferase [Synergistaceae bacterium]|jgi:putative phosphotransacetylase|nr:phosphate propanoyltransferase [Synergistaceae bacterium]
MMPTVADKYEINPDKLSEVIKRAVEKYVRNPYVMAEISNRHIHISRVDLDALFGEGYELTPMKELLPGQYACDETVAVVGRKGRFERVRLLAPIRGKTQLEISMTDSFLLGVEAPVNISGDLRSAATVAIENPQNGAKIERACAIVALRHIHLSLEFAKRYGLRDQQVVAVEFEGPRAVTFGNVLLRVSKDFTDEMHLDIDEANAGGIKNGDYGRIIV